MAAGELAAIRTEPADRRTPGADQRRRRDGGSTGSSRSTAVSVAGHDDLARAAGLLELAASRSRLLLEEVAKVEHGMARHVLRLRGLVLRYVKALLALLTTALAVYAGDAVVEGFDERARHDSVGPDLVGRDRPGVGTDGRVGGDVAGSLDRGSDARRGRTVDRGGGRPRADVHRAGFAADRGSRVGWPRAVGMVLAVSRRCDNRPGVAAQGSRCWRCRSWRSVAPHASGRFRSLVTFAS